MAKKMDDVVEEIREAATRALSDAGDSLKKNADDVADGVRKHAEARRQLDGEMGPGEFKSVNRNHKFLNQKLGGEYERQVTGRDDGKEYAVQGSMGNEVKFDGFVDGKLIETKHGYGKMIDSWGYPNGAKEKDWLDQALRQVDAAGDTPVEWVFSNKEAMEAARTLFEDFDLPISLRHQEFVKPPSDWDGWDAPTK